MKYKAVLFDMDGTVLDTLGDLAAAVNHTLREFSMPERSIAEVAAALGNGAAYLIAHTVPAGTPKELTDKVLAAYAPYYDAHCDILTGPYDGIVPLMQKLRERGVKLAVISNKQDTAVKPLAEKYFPGLLEDRRRRERRGAPQAEPGRCACSAVPYRRRARRGYIRRRYRGRSPDRAQRRDGVRISRLGLPHARTARRDRRGAYIRYRAGA